MTVLSLVMVLCVELIQSATSSTNSVVYSDNPPFTRDFEMINRLGQAKDATGLDNMAATLKSRWKDVDMDCYCRLMNELCGAFRTDFDPVDWDKLKALSDDVLSDLEMRLKQSIDPVLVGHYYGFQDWYISIRYVYTPENEKGRMDDDAWAHKRKDVISRLLEVWKLVQDAKDPNWSMDVVLYAQVMPPNGAPPGTSPDSIKDPGFRAKYEADIKENDEKKQWWDAQYRLNQTEDFLKKRLLNDIKVMYNTSPLAPDELKGLLDTYVKDEEQKKMFLEASQK
jgi:hypothetical protein